MPIISGQVTHHGPLAAIRIGVSRNRERLLKKHRMAVPPRVTLNAIIDTGSFVTAFSRRVFESLNIEPFNKILIRTPSTRKGERCECDQYDVSVELVSGTTTAYLPSVKAVTAADFDDDDEHVQAILGRDILQCCNFFYFGPEAKFQLAF